MKKKLLLISDDLRTNSGVATVSKEIIFQTLDRFDWVQIGGSITHPEHEREIDLSAEVKKVDSSLQNPYLKLYPTNGYGSEDFIRYVIEKENPDMLLLFTDPRFFEHVFQMENEIRKSIPITYINIWDDLPYPHYNKKWYKSCDGLLCISKQTENIVKNVLYPFDEYDINNPEKFPEYVTYFPHGINSDVFFPIKNKETNVRYNEVYKNVFGEEKPEFVIFYNSRNIRRKQTSDVIIAFKRFCQLRFKDNFEDYKKVCLLLHTDPIDPNGTDLPKVVEHLAPECNIKFSANKITAQDLNILYNIADITVNISSAEGWGLGITESIMAGTPVTSVVCGGLQDQMRFTDIYGNWIKFNRDFPTNSNGKYKNCSEWADPIFCIKNLVGSIPTPYIYESRVSVEDVAKSFDSWYLTKLTDTPGIMDELGLNGRNWLLSDEANMNAVNMGNKFVNHINNIIERYKNYFKDNFKLIDINEEISNSKKHLPTGLIYN